MASDSLGSVVVAVEHVAHGVGAGVGLCLPGVSTSPAVVPNERAQSRQMARIGRFIFKTSNVIE